MGMCMLALFSKFFHDERGTAAIEYGVMVGLVSVVMIPALGHLGDALRHTFDAVGIAMSGSPH